MADKVIVVDTSILIDHFRKSVKANSKLVALYDEGYEFCISAVTEFEIYSGASNQQVGYWQEFLRNIQVLSFDRNAVEQAVKIYNSLKRKSKQVDTADLFIAATALSNNLSIATLNRKHFERIDGLALVS